MTDPTLAARPLPADVAGLVERFSGGSKDDLDSFALLRMASADECHFAAMASEDADIIWQWGQDVVDALTAQAAQIADLTAERDALIATRDMMGNLWAKEKARADAERERAEDQAALVTCGCAYDKPTDLCMAHKRILDRLRAADIARAEKDRAENARLRAAIMDDALVEAYRRGVMAGAAALAVLQEADQPTCECGESRVCTSPYACAAMKGGDND